MPRKNSPSGVIKATVKEVARAQRQAAIQRKRTDREHEKDLQQRQKQTKQEYLEQRLADVDEINGEIAEWIHQLETLLESTLGLEDIISFEDLRIRETFPAMEVPQELLAASTLPKFHKPKSPPQWLIKLLPFLEQQYIKTLKQAESNYQLTKKKFEEADNNRQVSLEHCKANYEWKKHSFILDIKKRNAEVDELEAAYQDGEESAVEIYNEMVLERSEYPSLEEFKYISYTNQDKSAFTQQFKVVYVPESKQLVIDYELPAAKIIPTIAEVNYDHSKDEIHGVARKPIEIEELYQDIVAAITLRTITEVFTADLAQHLDKVIFNGFVHTVDSTTGKDVQTYLISVRATKDSFSGIDVNNIDKLACLGNLEAEISSNLTAMRPVQPIVDFNMVNAKSTSPENIHTAQQSSPSYGVQAAGI
jgi:restriction system protein